MSGEGSAMARIEEAVGLQHAGDAEGARLRFAGVWDERATRHDASPAIRGLYPSLHLNLAADYHKLGDDDLARAHLSEAERYVDALNDDGYGEGIRSALRRLASEVGDS